MPHISSPRALLAVALVLAGTGCGVSQHELKPTDIRPLPNPAWRGNGPEGAYIRVRGLDSALAESPGAPVRVLLVHGMRTFEPGYSAVQQHGLAERLNLVPAQPQAEMPDTVTLLPVNREYEVEVAVGPQPLGRVALRESEVRRRAWVDPRDGRVRVVFYELLWAPLRDDVKRRFFACFEVLPTPDPGCPPPEAEQNVDRRAFFNRRIKDQILVDGFSDATIVLGPVGDVLRDDVSLALCMVATDVLRDGGFAVRQSPEDRCDLASSVQPADRPRANEALRAAEFFAMTHSLGSFLLMDALWTAADTTESRRGRGLDEAAATRDVAEFFLMDDATVFMRANQFALLNLARLGAVCVPRSERGRCPTEALPGVDEMFRAPDVFGMFTQYVAFNDVNDLLGFELPPYIASTGLAGTLVNVTVQNPTWRLLGLKNPGGAHNNSDRNPAILDAMVRGFDLPADRVPGNGFR
ncbi:MAG TPA: hypothetical protein VGC13_24685 [Longimicrobium sp.]|jgi:hypothetical protein|uniref:hypothetical protein n=1 Tax=Longimicrobium sp. TaxID=2029185 RepID=UPI002EDB8931